MRQRACSWARIVPRPAENVEGGVPRFRHHGGGSDQKIRLVVRVEGTRVRDVVEDVFAVHSVAFCDCEEALGTERALRVDEEAFAFSSFHVDRQLHDEPPETV